MIRPASRPTGRTSTTTTTAVVIAVLCLLLAPALAVPASASDVTEAEEAVADLGREVEVAAEDYNETRVELERLRAEATAAEARASAEAAALAQVQQQMVTLAVETFKQGGVDVTLAALFAGSAADALRNASTLDVVAGRQHATVADLRRAQERLAAEQQAADAAAAAAGRTEAELAAAKADIEARLAEAEDVLVEARQAQAARVAAAEAASRSRTALVAGGAAAGAVAADPGAGVPVATGGAGCGSVQAPDARVAAVLAFACSQLGKPYQWGATGPNSYDCSGFTAAAWAQAGVSLPHSSRAQIGVGTRVSASELRPGDLVFGYSPISHVGIYLGGGMMIHAPSTGDVVKVSPLSYVPFAGATRPAG